MWRYFAKSVGAQLAFALELDTDLFECPENVSVSIPTRVKICSIQHDTAWLEMTLCCFMKLSKVLDLPSRKFLISSM